LGVLHERPSDSSNGIDSLSGSLPSWCSTTDDVTSVLNGIAHWKPDLVYCNGLENQDLERALLDQYPAVLYAHTYYGTCISGRKCHAWPRIEPCSREFGGACLALYHVRRCGGFNPRTMWQLFQIQSKRKQHLGRYQAVLVASRHMREELARQCVSHNRLHLLPLFPTDSVPDSSAPVTKDSSGRILFLGRLMDVKGVDTLLEATSIASKRLEKRLTLTIAGDGPDRAKLEKAARRLGVHAEFTGWVNGESKSLLLRRADLVAVPSLWPEPFGLVGIEAGCWGVPAVGFAVGGIPDWLIPGRTGELAPGNPPTAQGLADAMVRALSDASHYQALRQGAWDMAKHFSLKLHTEQLELILAAAAPASEPVAVNVQ
jgi:glycosyltransferase involved in cell wall biosynthesis